jgi:hypothetical protein
MDAVDDRIGILLFMAMPPMVAPPAARVAVKRPIESMVQRGARLLRRVVGGLAEA